MAINFPSSPSIDQVYTYGNRKWKWNGEGWERTGYGRVVSIHSLAYNANLTFDLTYDMGEVTLTGNTTIDFTGGVDGQIFRVRIKQGGSGSYTAGYSANVKFDIGAVSNAFPFWMMGAVM